MTGASRSAPPRDHSVTFYDDEAELVDELADFVVDGLGRGESVLLVLTPAHLSALVASLDAVGCSLDEATSRGQCVVADAATTMAGFLRDDLPDPELFFASVGGLVAQAEASGRPLRVFGEMVALLWERGDVASAMALEALWNRLGRVQRFFLLCGYPTTSLATPGDLQTVRAICDVHSAVLPPVGYDADEVLGLEASAEVQSRVFVASLPAVRAARLFVTSTLHAWEEAPLIPDAALLVSELATNALRHADSPFRVTLERSGDRVRLAIEDVADRAPELRAAKPDDTGGRGMALVEALSETWGYDAAAAGKTVWCELRRRQLAI